MGISPSLLPLARSRELSQTTRWSPALTKADLKDFATWYRLFRELSDANASPRQVSSVIRLSPESVAEAAAVSIADIWEVDIDGSVDVWEFLTLLVATSGTISLKTKILFFFRMWDVDQDRRLHTAEVALLLRALISGFAFYCRCDRSLLPTMRDLRIYAQRTFKTFAPEEKFVHWVMRHRLTRPTLVAFTSSSTKMVDMLDFVLSGPEDHLLALRFAHAKRSVHTVGTQELSAALASAAAEEAAEAEKDAEADEDAEERKTRESAGEAEDQFGDLPDAESQANENKKELVTRQNSQKSVELPPLSPGLSSRVSSHTIFPPITKQFIPRNGAANLQVQSEQLGRLKLLDAHASTADAQHTCPLHTDPLECMRLSKPEVLFANRLWNFLMVNKDIDFNAVRGLLELLKAEIGKHESIVAQTEHRSIFKLTDFRVNPYFEDVVRRIRRGEQVRFREFLQGISPCASEPRLHLYVHWHAQGHWMLEQQFTGLLKKWRKDSESQREKSADQEIEVNCLRMDMAGQPSLVAAGSNKTAAMPVFVPMSPARSSITVGELMASHAVSDQVAEEVLSTHDITMESVITENDFIHMFCRDGMRTKSNSTFEDLMRARFKAVAGNFQHGRFASDGADKPINSDEDRGLALDALVGTVDLKAAFSFTDSIDDDTDGYYPVRRTSGEHTPMTPLSPKTPRWR